MIAGIGERLIDRALEASIVGSFTRIGYAVRRRLFRWQPLEALRLDGKNVVVTGATSGIGRSAAETMARMGARVCIVGRDATRTERARSEIAKVSGREVEAGLADLSSLAETRTFTEWYREEHDCLDVLVLNAGALTHPYTETAEGNEVTLATHVLSPFLLVAELRPLLEASASARVIFVSSGGMYAEPLDVDLLVPSPAGYNGTKVYARCKRAQVALAGAWSRQLDGVAVNAMHPGWANTAALRESLPGFSRLLRPFLRTPTEAADSIVWLAASPEAAAVRDAFILDRLPRTKHRLRRTRRADESSQSTRLWELCVTRTDPAKR